VRIPTRCIREAVHSIVVQNSSACDCYIVSMSSIDVQLTVFFDRPRHELLKVSNVNKLSALSIGHAVSSKDRYSNESCVASAVTSSRCTDSRQQTDECTKSTKRKTHDTYAQEFESSVRLLLRICDDMSRKYACPERAALPVADKRRRADDTRHIDHGDGEEYARRVSMKYLVAGHRRWHKMRSTYKGALDATPGMCHKHTSTRIKSTDTLRVSLQYTRVPREHLLAIERHWRVFKARCPDSSASYTYDPDNTLAVTCLLDADEDRRTLEEMANLQLPPSRLLEQVSPPTVVELESRWTRNVCGVHTCMSGGEALKHGMCSSHYRALVRCHARSAEMYASQFSAPSPF